jgi:DNA-binding CsgD family transcriptional regulator
MDRHSTQQPSIAFFEQSLLPMLIADDSRRYVDANRAACLLLRLPREQVLELTVDDLTPAEDHAGMESLWSEFLRTGTQSGPFELAMPDVMRINVDYSATAHFAPSRHLGVLGLPTIDPSSVRPTLEDAEQREPHMPLSDREREVLARVAMGETGEAIARALSISFATVETHVRHCLAKLGAKNRPHAIALGLQRGEITLAGWATDTSTVDRAEP